MRLTHSPFFIASCGCIGLDLGQSHWSIIKACDADYDEDRLGLSRPAREWDPEKTYTPLDEKTTLAILENLGTLVYLGHRLGDVTRIVGGHREPLPWDIQVLSPVDKKGRADYSKHYVKAVSNREPESKIEPLTKEEVF